MSLLLQNVVPLQPKTNTVDCMRYVKWLLVASVCALVSFVDKDNIGNGYSIGDRVPQFAFPAATDGQPSSLRQLQGGYVLLNFWASYDAPSRTRNVQLHRALETLPENVKVRMVSISFDRYRSVFEETVQSDSIGTVACFVDVSGESSPLYKKFRLKRGFRNYLLDAQGVILAKDVQANEIAAYIK